ncbi:MAG: ABC transporter ATP-binding protein [Candidatus Bipolaricaulota bacterium]|nr:MAG: ABC transporter ATP-binding protein [Candidatus Bipolaricaulota bacterium]
MRLPVGGSAARRQRKGASLNAVEVAVQLRGITKRFPGVVANDGVDLSVRRGEIHCLLGENGAGKTTLMRILYGLYQPDEGEILLENVPTRIPSPRAALAHRIGMVHQHFHLVPTLSVEENVVLGLDEGTGPLLRRRRIRQKIERLAAEYGLQVDPTAKVWQLSVGQQQRVEILKALYRDASILIMDEPTSVLTPQEVEALFTTLRTLVDDGLTIIFITHKLDEVMQASDRVTVLRRGSVVATVETATTSKEGLARLMVGREVVFRLEKRAHEVGDRVLEVRDLHAHNDRGLTALRGVSFDLHEGEILGVAGVSGNGQHELSEVLTGLRRATRGSAVLETRDLARCSAREIADLGVAHVPTERIRMGTVPTMSIRENLILKSYRRPEFCRWTILDEKAAYENACRAMDEYEISAPGDGTAAKNLSGGNIQRLVLARELCGSPRFVVAAHPTYGLDVGATEQIRQVLLDQRDRGAAILLISEDLDEIMQLSDRILVLYEGEVMGVVDAEDAELEGLGLMMAGTRQGAGVA